MSGFGFYHVHLKPNTEFTIMSGIPNLKDLVFRDTPFANLMNNPNNKEEKK